MIKFKSLLTQYKVRFGFTLFLIVAEALLVILFPLFIGKAIDGALQKSHSELVALGVLGVVVLIVGVGRRVFDSRFYARIYQDVGVKAIANLNGVKTSVKSARLGMIGEWVEFMENSFPDLVNALIGLVGVIVIIAKLNLNVFYGSIITTGVIFIIYWMSSGKTIQLNRLSNNELEKQVEVLAKNDNQELNFHLRKMMKWNVKLSDLESLNFSLSWIVLMSLLVATIAVSLSHGIVKYGVLFSLIMYVFQYIEHIVNLPFFYQNWLRLVEIGNRIDQEVEEKMLNR